MFWSTLAGKLEQAKALDPVADAADALVHKALPRGPVKDALHGTWLGHALHPMLIAGPIGMWSSAIVLDWTGGDRNAGRRLVGAGLLTVLPTVASGWADWSELGSAKRPKRVGLVHALANASTSGVFAASWLARRRGDHARGRRLALAGAAGLGVGGFLGGHLAYSQGVGVNRNADEQKKPRDWVDAARAEDLVEGTPRRVEVKGQAVVLVRSGGQIRAIGATCSHWGAPLEEGELVRDGGETCLERPWHGSRFRLADGSVARGPATSPQLGYDVQVVGGSVQVRVRA